MRKGKLYSVVSAAKQTFSLDVKEQFLFIYWRIVDVIVGHPQDRLNRTHWKYLFHSKFGNCIIGWISFASNFAYMNQDERFHSCVTATVI